MRSRLTAITASACALVLLLGVATLSYRLGEASDRGGVARPAAVTAPADGADLATLEELLQRIQTEAVDAPPEEVLVEGAIEGMLDTLDDPYALYYDAAEFARFNRNLDGSFSGVGLLLEEAPEGPTVVRALPDTPAEQAGIEAGEIIVAVDGEDVSDLPLTAIVDLVTGEEGTTVRLGLEGGPGGPREVELTRAQIEAPTVEAELLEDGAGLARLSTFSQNAAEQLGAAVEDLLTQGAEGIILDLRGNPGGLLEEAVDVVSLFVEDELVVSVREPTGDDRPLRAAESGRFTEVPLVVLVDAFSASASEIVAAAMQDIGRAEVVGETTFGKGTVQTVRPLTEGGGVKFTTAEYLTPSGESIEGTGVEPDTVAADEGDQVAAAQEALRRVLTAAAGR